MPVQAINCIYDKNIQVVKKAENPFAMFMLPFDEQKASKWLVGRAGFEPAIFAA
jgi:hypothetical protein